MGWAEANFFVPFPPYLLLMRNEKGNRLLAYSKAIGGHVHTAVMGAIVSDC